MRIALALVLAWALPLTARAGLNFEATSLDVKAESGAAQLSIKFPFKITGDKTVTILAAESDCGCTTAGLDKKEYEPGETGVITANFTVGDRVGPQLKQIRVRARRSGGSARAHLQDEHSDLREGATAVRVLGQRRTAHAEVDDL